MKTSLSDLVQDKKNQAISCPLEIENIRVIDGKCLYFLKLAKTITAAQRYCEVIFSPDSNGTIYEPSSEAEHNKMAEEAEKIFSGVKGQLILKYIFIDQKFMRKQISFFETQLNFVTQTQSIAKKNFTFNFGSK